MRKLLIMHGGAPTTVINSSLAGCIKTGQDSKAFSSILAAKYGTGGLLKEELIELTAATESQLELLKHTPGSAIGTGRDHLEEEDYLKMIEICLKHGITDVAMNGGNGTMDTARRFASISERFGIKVCGIPKTIDNDLSGTDHSPGFASAGRYMAASVRELIQDVKSLPIHIVVVEAMGRDVGWIAASSAFAREKGEIAPHMILTSEAAFDEDRFLTNAELLYKRFGGVIIVASEGIKDASGKPISDPIMTIGRSTYYSGVASHLATTIVAKLGIKARSETPGILGRCSYAWSSELDRREAFECGSHAVRALLEGQSNMMSSIFVDSREPYRNHIEMVEIEDSVLKEKKMPKEFFDEDRYDVTDAFLEYASPLIGKDSLGSFISFTEKN